MTLSFTIAISIGVILSLLLSASLGGTLGKIAAETCILCVTATAISLPLWGVIELFSFFLGLL